MVAMMATALTIVEANLSYFALSLFYWSATRRNAIISSRWRGRQLQK